MPPLPRIQTDALAALAEELRFAPRHALLRDIGRAEALAGEIDPSLTYPLDWIVFRLTGYRPDNDQSVLVDGNALIHDLSAMVERLCHACQLRIEECDAQPIWADVLASRWKVSRKTIDRWRRRGLVGRKVFDEQGTSRLGFMPQVVEAFAAAHQTMLERAARFARLDDAEQEQIVRWAAGYRRHLGWGLTACADRIGRRLGRSHETIRQVLLRHDQLRNARGSDGIFARKNALDASDRRAIYRQWAAGVEPDELAKTHKRTRSSIHSIISQVRLAHLQELNIADGLPVDAMAMDDDAIASVLKEWHDAAGDAHHAGEVIPGSVPIDLVDLLAWMHQQRRPDPKRERLGAMCQLGLRARAARAIQQATSGGRSTARARDLDRAETDLRHAGWVRLELAQSQFRLVLESVAQALGTALIHMRQQDALRTIELCLQAIGEGMDRFDPWKGGRLASPVGLACARLAAGLAKELDTHDTHSTGRAQLRLGRGCVGPDVLEELSPWVGTIGPDVVLRKSIQTMTSTHARVLAMRFGIGSGLPNTLEELAQREGITIMQAGRRVRQAVRAARMSAAQLADEL